MGRRARHDRAAVHSYPACNASVRDACRSGAGRCLPWPGGPAVLDLHTLDLPKLVAELQQGEALYRRQDYRVSFVSFASGEVREALLDLSRVRLSDDESPDECVRIARSTMEL